MSRPIDGDALASIIEDVCGRFDGGNDYDSSVIGRIIAGAPTLTLNDLRDEIYQDALEHGLWRPDATTADAAQLVRGEAMELIYEASDTGAEPTEDFCMELADCIIMPLSVSGRLGIDIDAYARRKMAINHERPWMHGKEEA